MALRRLRLEGQSLQQLRAQVLAEHGPEARIVAAERVMIGGIHGFFARQHYEVTVEIPDRRRASHLRLDLPARTGIAALLESADEAESRMLAAEAEPRLSTSSPDFAELMDQLTFDVGPLPTVSNEKPDELAPLPPRPRTGPGDLVLIVGLGGESLSVAQSMAAINGGEVVVGGRCLAQQFDRVDDRRSALAARARGVQAGHPVFVGYGLELQKRDSEEAVFVGVSALALFGADQIWVVVDASRKPDDTARWVRAVGAVVAIDAMVVERSQFTVSPETVDELGLARGWIGRQSPR